MGSEDDVSTVHKRYFKFNGDRPKLIKKKKIFNIHWKKDKVSENYKNVSLENIVEVKDDLNSSNRPNEQCDSKSHSEYEPSFSKDSVDSEEEYNSNQCDSKSHSEYEPSLSEEDIDSEEDYSIAIKSDEGDNRAPAKLNNKKLKNNVIKKIQSEKDEVSEDCKNDFLEETVVDEDIINPNSRSKTNLDSKSHSEYEPSFSDESIDSEEDHSTAVEFKRAKSNIINDEMNSSNSSKIIQVIGTTNRDEGRRKWDKKDYCLHCEKPFSKLPRHLENIHADEDEESKLIKMKSAEE